MTSHAPTDINLKALLRQLGCEWSQRRSWAVEPASPHGAGDSIPIEGPALAFRWNPIQGPVAISFLPRPESYVIGDERQLLIIEISNDCLRILHPDSAERKKLPLDPANRHQVADLLGQIQAIAASASDLWHDELNFVASALRLTVLAHDIADDSNAEPVDRPATKQAIVGLLHEWLRPNLENSIRLADAARHFKKSPRQLIRILKETTGAGFAEHLTIHRLTLARSLLMRSDQSVMEVAHSSGFNSREQFIRAFNKAFGWTPLQFRKAWNRASLSEDDLVQLCRVSDRRPVDWLEPGKVVSQPVDPSNDGAHTLIVANALHEIIELFQISPLGKRTRVDVLERGGMFFVSRDLSGSQWTVRAPGSNFERSFVTDDHHAIAIVSAKVRKFAEVQ